MKRAVFLYDNPKSGAGAWWTWTLLPERSACWDCILAPSEEGQAEVTEMPLAHILSARLGKVETSGSRIKLDKMRLLRDSISLLSCYPPNAVRTAPRKPCGQGCM